MKYAAVTICIFAIAAAGAAVYELGTLNPPIHAKPEQQSNNNIPNSYLTKPYVQVVIKANDGTRQTFIITQTQFTGIQTAKLIASSTNTNFPVNATLDNIANFLSAHSGQPPHIFNSQQKSSIT